MILLIDNYDSFTWNLHDYMLRLGATCKVVRNDEIDAETVSSLSPAAIVCSPGPKKPSESGNMMSIIAYHYSRVPILGICLGYQAIGEFFGAKLIKAPKPVHGKTTDIMHDSSAVFRGLPNPLRVMRYHSLMLSGLENTTLKITAHTTENEPMAFEHRDYPIYGLQFHPEAWLTEQGINILKNWLETIEV